METMVLILFFLLSSFFSFFLLYHLSKHDFVLLRKNISTPEIFDQAFISILVGFFLGRIFYILDTFQFKFLNPIIFFHLLRFPGFVFFGFFIGIGISLFVLFRKKNALLRIYDIFSLSFLPLYTFFILVRKYNLLVYATPVVLFALSAMLFYFLLKSHKKYSLRDGSVTLIFLLFISLDIFIYGFFDELHILFFLSFSQIIGALSASFVFITFLIYQKKLFGRN